MQIWQNYFLAITFFVGFLVWFTLPRMAPHNGNRWVKLLTRLAVGFSAFSLLGAALAVAAHAYESDQITGKVIENPFGASAYFVEIGWESGVIWIPVMLIRAIWLFARGR